MSLDVSLYISGEKAGRGTGIFVRENGQNREISWAEWNEKFPGTEPIVALVEDDDDDVGYVFSANITHNLGTMASEADLYKIVWRPEENGIKSAQQLIEPLQKGLERLKAKPEHFKQFDAPNGWGIYANFVKFIEEYLQACIQYPEATVTAYR